MAAFNASIGEKGTIRLTHSLTVSANGGPGVAGATVRIFAPIVDVGAVEALTAGGNTVQATPNRLDIQAGHPCCNVDVIQGNLTAVFSPDVNSSSQALRTGSLTVNGPGNNIKVMSGPGTSSPFIDGNISASGGGTVTINVNAATEFKVGLGSTASGVNGRVIVDGGRLTGNGGVIDIQNQGAGGLNLLSGDAISAPPGPEGGSGGTIRLKAPSGRLTLSPGTISADAMPNVNNVPGVGQFAGVIDLLGQTLTVSSSGNTRLSATGVRGSSSSISLTTLGLTSDFGIGPGNGQISISAGGGDNVINVTAGRDLSVDMAGIDTTGRTTGSFLTLFAGRNLFVLGEVSVGQGSVLLRSNSASPFVIGAGAQINGVTGAVMANAPDTLAVGQLGFGGAIQVTNIGSGGVYLTSATNLSARASAQGGSGGRITLQARNGLLRIGGGTLSADAAGANPSAGTGGGVITIDAGKWEVVEAPLVLSANAAPVSGAAAGSITINVFGVSPGPPAEFIFGSGAGQVSFGEGSPGSATLVRARVTGNVSVAGELDLSRSKVDVRFLIDGSFSAQAAVKVGNNPFDMAAGAGVTVAASITGGSGTVTLRTSGDGIFINTGSIFVGAPVNLTGGALFLRADRPNQTITLAADIGAGPITMETGSNGHIIQTAGTISGTSLTMSGGGNFGSFSAPLWSAVSNLRVVTTGSAFIYQSGPVALASSTVGSTFQLLSSGPISVTGPVLALQVSLEAAAGSNAGITLGADLTGTAFLGSSVYLRSDGSGSIEQSAGLVKGPNIVLASDSGSIGTPERSINTQGAAASVTTSGTGGVFIANTGGILFAPSAAGSQFRVTATGLVTLSDVTTENGSIDVLTTSNGIRILDGSKVGARGGNLVLRSTDTASGFISVGAGSELRAAGSQSVLGNVKLVIGTIPVSLTGGPVPDNVSVMEFGGAVISFGENSISALAPTNTVGAAGKQVIFSTGALPAAAISLNGGVTILAAPSGDRLESLDLTDPSAVAHIQLLQARGVVGGTLEATGGVATGGNVVILPNNLEPVLSAENIPENVTVTMHEFRLGDSLFVSLGPLSTTPVVINGTQEFVSAGGGSAGNLIIGSSEISREVLRIGSGGRLTSDGDLTVTAQGDVVVNGTVAGSHISLQTAIGSNGSIAISGHVEASYTALLAADSNGSITSNGGIITAPTVLLFSDTGSIGSQTANITILASLVSANTGAGGGVFVTSRGDVQLAASSAGSVLAVTSEGRLTVAGRLTANTVKLETVSDDNGDIIVDADVSATGPDNIVIVRAGGGGSISHPNGVLSGTTVDLSSDTGAIGFGGSEVFVAADTLKVNTGAGGSTFIRSLGAVRLVQSSAGERFDLASLGPITIVDGLAANSVALETAVGTHANIVLEGTVSGTGPNNSVFMYADGTGSIIQANAAASVSGRTLRLFSDSGSIGSAERPISTSVEFLSANIVAASVPPAGGVFIANGGGVEIFSSHGGSSFEVRAGGPVSLGDISTDIGPITISTATGGLDIQAGASIIAVGGEITLRATDATAGSIFVGAGASLVSVSDPLARGRVSLVIGDQSSPVEAGTAPENVNLTQLNGGHILFGVSGISAQSPENTIIAAGGDIVFNAGSLPAVAIRLGGDVTIGAAAFGSTLSSLDLTDPVTVIQVRLLQARGILGGALEVASGLALGGNVIVTPDNLVGTVSALSVPTNITLIMRDFSASTPLLVALGPESTSDTVTIAGMQEFISTSGVSSGVLQVENERQGVPVVVIAPSGRLQSDGTLAVSAEGGISIEGSISASSVFVETASGSNGSVGISGNVLATGTVMVAVDGDGAVNQVSGLVSASNVIIKSGNGLIGAPDRPVLLSAANVAVSTGSGGSAFLHALGPVTLMQSSAGGTIDVLSDGSIMVAESVFARTVILTTSAGSNGDIVVSADIAAPVPGGLVRLTADERGSILQSNSTAQIHSERLELTSGQGDIGTDANPLLTSVATLSANTSRQGTMLSGGAFISNAGDLAVVSSHAGSGFQVVSDGDILLDGISTSHGPASIIATSGGIQVKAGTTISVRDGSLTLQSLDLLDGSIVFEPGSSIRTVSPLAGVGDIDILIGAKTEVAGQTPSSTTISVLEPGAVFFGEAGITSLESQSGNVISAHRKQITFSSGPRPASAIVLGGGVTITGAPYSRVADSLDLTNPDVAAQFEYLQAVTLVGGVLQFSDGKIIGGNLVITPDDLSQELSAYVIPANVAAILQGFTESTPVTVRLDAGSSSPVVTISGTQRFTAGSASSTGEIAVNTSLDGPALVVTSTGSLSSDGALKVVANAGIVVGGAVGGERVRLETSAGDIAQAGAGSVISASQLELAASQGNVGSVNGALLTEAGSLSVAVGGSAYLHSLGPVTLEAGSVRDTLQVVANGSVSLEGAISGREIVIGAESNSGGSITLNADIVGTGLGSLVSLNADGSGLIVQGTVSSVISAETVLLESGSGSIGSASSAVRTVASIVRANTSGSGGVFLANAGAISVARSSSGSDFQLTSSGDIVVSQVTTSKGSIAITGTAGGITVLQEGLLAARGGNLNLKATDDVAGYIKIGHGASLLAESLQAELGNVSLTVGSAVAEPTSSVVPEHVTVNVFDCETARNSAAVAAL